jgi:hypothetical protein
MARGKRDEESVGQRNDVVPDDVEIVEVWHDGRPITRLLPMAPPGRGELVVVNGQIRQVLDRRYDADSRTARIAIA